MIKKIYLLLVMMVISTSITFANITDNPCEGISGCLITDFWKQTNKKKIDTTNKADVDTILSDDYKKYNTEKNGTFDIILNIEPEEAEKVEVVIDTDETLKIKNLTDEERIKEEQLFEEAIFKMQELEKENKKKEVLQNSNINYWKWIAGFMLLMLMVWIWIFWYKKLKKVLKKD